MSAPSAADNEELMKLDMYSHIGGHKDMTSKQLKKAFRDMALKTHPDKNRDDPDAKTKFDQLKKVWDFLSDTNLKALYDAKIKAQQDRVERLASEDAVRRQARQNLEKREKEAEQQMMNKRRKTEAEIVRQQDAFFLEKLKSQWQMEDASRENQRAAAAASRPTADADASRQLYHSILVRISKNVEAKPEVLRARIRQMFEVYGRITEIVMLDKKAYVVYEDRDQAELAVATHDPLHTNFRISLMQPQRRPEPAPQHKPAPAAADRARGRTPPPQPAAVAPMPPVTSSAGKLSDKERMMMMRLKAAKRKNLEPESPSVPGAHGGAVLGTGLGSLSSGLCEGAAEDSADSAGAPRPTAPGLGAPAAGPAPT
jgi:curved DNA-binding protein CbpA